MAVSAADAASSSGWIWVVSLNATAFFGPAELLPGVVAGELVAAEARLEAFTSCAGISSGGCCWVGGCGGRTAGCGERCAGGGTVVSPYEKGADVAGAGADDTGGATPAAGERASPRDRPLGSLLMDDGSGGGLGPPCTVAEVGPGGALEGGNATFEDPLPVALPPLSQLSPAPSPASSPRTQDERPVPQSKRSNHAGIGLGGRVREARLAKHGLWPWSALAGWAGWLV